MPRFSKISKTKLNQCDQRLILIANKLIKIVDLSIISGHRGKKEQNNKFTQGLTKLKYPQSKHNTNPSKALDFTPYPVDWNDSRRFILVAGIMIGIAESHGIKLRWGGDWNSNFNMKDNNFDDLGHIELID